MFEDLDFSFNLDFGESSQMTESTIDAVVERLKCGNRVVFCIDKQARQLDSLIPEPPKREECFKMLSGKNGFSSIAIIDYILRRKIIRDLFVSTFHIGQRQMELLERNTHRIGNATFVTSDLQEHEEDRDKYNYGRYVKSVCYDKGWDYITFNNHSKVILMRTDEDFFVCETSSNLCTNPKLEQFSFENNEQLCRFYERMFTAIKNTFEKGKTKLCKLN